MVSITAMPLAILRNNVPSYHTLLPASRVFGRAVFCSTRVRVCQLCLWWDCSQLVLSTEATEEMTPVRGVSTDLSSTVFLQR